jgi:hypothetical protein
MKFQSCQKGNNKEGHLLFCEMMDLFRPMNSVLKKGNLQKPSKFQKHVMWCIALSAMGPIQDRISENIASVARKPRMIVSQCQLNCLN